MQRKTVTPGPLHMPSALNLGFRSSLSPCAKTTLTLAGTLELPHGPIHSFLPLHRAAG